MAKHAIGGKNLNSGIRGGLWEKKHSDAMGDAVWLFGWLVHRQTTERNGRGLVLRGKPLTYADISADTDFPESTLRRWMARLRKAGYIEVKYSLYSRMVVRILNAKKFTPRQLEFPVAITEPSRPELHDMELSSRAGLGDLTAKVERLKERADLEQKKLEAAAAGPADPNPADVWAFLGIAPCGPAEFRQLLESRWSCRNGRSPATVLGETVDAWEAATGEKPRRTGAFFRALAEIRKREREAAEPTLDEIAPIPPEIMEHLR